MSWTALPSLATAILTGRYRGGVSLVLPVDSVRKRPKFCSRSANANLSQRVSQLAFTVASNKSKHMRPTAPDRTSRRRRWCSRGRRAWAVTFGRRGLFGIEGEYFELRIAVQETIEIVLQSCQCYRMSWLLSRMWLQRLFVAMIVINCWTGALIHFVGHHRSPRSRVLLLVIDAFLDVVSTIIIPCMLFQTYYLQFDTERTDFPISFYYRDEWLMNFLNEFQLLLVNQWLDLMMRCTFATSLLLGVTSMKATFQRAVGSAGTVLPGTSSHDVNKTESAVQPPKSPIPILSSHRSSVANNVLHCHFLVLGGVVLYAQLAAEANGQAKNCIVPVHPWFREKAGCALVELSGVLWSVEEDTKDTLTRELAEFDEAVVSYLILRNHSALRVPTNIRNLSNLVGLKLDNVSLAEWGDDAALTNSHHERLAFLFLVRFNATAIPPGLLSTDFPRLLLDIEICETTLPGLPPSLPSVWPEHLWLYVDFAGWTDIPEVALRMKLDFLHVANNQIHSVSAMWFVDTTFSFLVLSGNPISTLPEDSMIPRPIPLQRLNLESTNISTLPLWLDITRTKVIAGNTPYCNDPDHKLDRSAGEMPICSHEADCRTLHHQPAIVS